MRATAILIMAAAYGFWASAYFGHNLFPKSEAEVITDGLCILLTAIGVLCAAVDGKR